MLTILTDVELVEEIRRGNMAAFRTLYYRHVDTVYGLVSRLFGHRRRTDVDDAVQEVFLQVHRSLPRFEGISAFATWLHRITVNVCFSQFRRRSFDEQPRPTDPSGGPAVPAVQEAGVDARRQVSRMFAYLETMSDDNRTVFVLYEFQGLTLAEISEILEIPLHTAASRLRRSRAAVSRAVGRGAAASLRGAK